MSSSNIPQFGRELAPPNEESPNIPQFGRELDQETGPSKYGLIGEAANWLKEDYKKGPSITERMTSTGPEIKKKYAERVEAKNQRTEETNKALTEHPFLTSGELAVGAGRGLKSPLDLLIMGLQHGKILPQDVPPDLFQELLDRASTGLRGGLPEGEQRGLKEWEKAGPLLPGLGIGKGALNLAKKALKKRPPLYETSSIPPRAGRPAQITAQSPQLQGPAAGQPPAPGGRSQGGPAKTVGEQVLPSPLGLFTLEKGTYPSGLTKPRAAETAIPKFGLISSVRQQEVLKSLEDEASNLVKQRVEERLPIAKGLRFTTDPETNKVIPAVKYEDIHKAQFSEIRHLAKRANPEIDINPLTKYFEESSRPLINIPSPSTDEAKILKEISNFAEKPTGSLEDLVGIVRSNNDKLSKLAETRILKGRQEKYARFLEGQNQAIYRSIKETLPEDSAFYKKLKDYNQNFTEYRRAQDALLMLDDILGTQHRAGDFITIGHNFRKQRKLASYVGQKTADEIIQIARDLEAAHAAVKRVRIAGPHSLIHTLSGAIGLATEMTGAPHALLGIPGLIEGALQVRNLFGWLLTKPKYRLAFHEALQDIAQGKAMLPPKKNALLKTMKKPEAESPTDLPSKNSMFNQRKEAFEGETDFQPRSPYSRNLPDKVVKGLEERKFIPTTEKTGLEGRVSEAGKQYASELSQPRPSLEPKVMEGNQSYVQFPYLTGEQPRYYRKSDIFTSGKPITKQPIKLEKLWDKYKLNKDKFSDYYNYDYEKTLDDLSANGITDKMVAETGLAKPVLYAILRDYPGSKFIGKFGEFFKNDKRLSKHFKKIADVPVFVNPMGQGTIGLYAPLWRPPDWKIMGDAIILKSDMSPASVHTNFCHEGTHALEAKKIVKSKVGDVPLLAKRYRGFPGRPQADPNLKAYLGNLSEVAARKFEVKTQLPAFKRAETTIKAHKQARQTPPEMPQPRPLD